jgi:hypothetical protein
MSRFQATKAVRSAIPLFIGICGASGSGKTYSALRLASGIRRVAGGKIVVVDTENGRALHYAESFEFEHLPFSPPFNPSSYVDAIEAAIEAGAKTVIVDSMSHEHTGIGGVLEMHEAEVQRLSSKMSESAASFPAWAVPKAERRQLLNYLSRLDVNLIACFRAKQKVVLEKNDRGRNEPRNIGWMPEAAPEFAFEMSALGVLYPGAKGVPDWHPGDKGTEMVTKRPAQFETVLDGQLSEDMGEKMALWARGNVHPAEPSALLKDALSRFEVARDAGNLSEAADFVADAKARLSTVELAACGRAYKAAKSRIDGAAIT